MSACVCARAYTHTRFPPSCGTKSFGLIAPWALMLFLPYIISSCVIDFARYCCSSITQTETWESFQPPTLFSLHKIGLLLLKYLSDWSSSLKSYCHLPTPGLFISSLCPGNGLPPKRSCCPILSSLHAADIPDFLNAGGGGRRPGAWPSYPDP